MTKNKTTSNILIYQTEDGKTKIETRLENETVWLTQEQADTMRKFGNSEFSTKPTNFYNLDVIISVGYRVKSLQGTKFRQWASARLKEYIVKGFTMNDELLKNADGGNYFEELLACIPHHRHSTPRLGVS